MGFGRRTRACSLRQQLISESCFRSVKFLWLNSVSGCVFSGLFFVLTIIYSPERSPPINEVVQSGVVPRFVDFLGKDEFPQLQVWFLARLCYSFCYWIHFMFLIVLFYGIGCSLVWGRLGPHKHCFRDIRKHPGCDWSWSHPHICQPSRLSEWWCSWTGVYL